MDSSYFVQILFRSNSSTKSRLTETILSFKTNFRIPDIYRQWQMDCMFARIASAMTSKMPEVWRNIKTKTGSANSKLRKNFMYFENPKWRLSYLDKIILLETTWLRSVPLTVRYWRSYLSPLRSNFASDIVCLASIADRHVKEYLFDTWGERESDQTKK